MQTSTLSKQPFDKKEMEAILKQENKFITELFNIMALPTHATDNEDVLLKSEVDIKAEPKFPNKQTSRAKSLVELQERISQLTSKKGLTYKQKLLKRNLKLKLKKKNKKHKFSNKLNNSANPEQTLERKNVVATVDQPLQAGTMEFSKIDFSNIGKQKKKEKQDPTKLLHDIRKHKTKVEELRESGDTEQASKIKEKQAWKNALARARGEKVKDDEHLLAKSIKKNKQKHKQSKKKWESRVDAVKKSQDDRQKKRQENIDKRKKTKKVNKMKKAVKRGKVIPGF